MTKQKCIECGKLIDFDKGIFVCLGTYEGDHTIEECYFHMKCYRKYFEEKANDKAQIIINKSSEVKE